MNQSVKIDNDRRLRELARDNERLRELARWLVDDGDAFDCLDSPMDEPPCERCEACTARQTYDDLIREG